MSSLSIVLIVKNEAAHLDACLKSAQFADEIVVVDSGSSDNTIAIAEKYGAKVAVESDWQGFGIQRQRAQALATSEWIFMLDADERITPQLRSSIERIIKENNQDQLYQVPRLSYVFGRFIRHSGWYPDYVKRLYPANKVKYSDALVHEKPEYPSAMQLNSLKGDLLHYTYNDMNHYLVKSAHYAKAWADQRQAKGKRSSLVQATIHGIGCFIKMYIVRAGFLDGRQGLLLALLSAHSTFVKYADLWTRSQPGFPEDEDS